MMRNVFATIVVFRVTIRLTMRLPPAQFRVRRMMNRAVMALCYTLARAAGPHAADRLSRWEHVSFRKPDMGDSARSHPVGASIWLRPGLARPAALDTALFDIDGVLIDVQRSYQLAVIHGAERLVRAAGLEPPTPMISPQDVLAFKLAGEFNNDWDVTQLFTALWTARLREWRGQPEADIPVADWAARAAAATREGRGGVAWVRATFPASAVPSAEAARWAHDEFYWGAALVREIFGHEPVYAPDATGFVHNEELLFVAPPDAPEVASQRRAPLLAALEEFGITRWGLITGRLGPEVDWAVRALAEAFGPEDAARAWYDSAYGRSPFASIVPATVYAKPDPRALQVALDEVGAAAAVYVGDTADDLDVVLRYRRELQTRDHSRPPVLAAMVASGETADTYQQRGADIVITRVMDLPVAIRWLR
jgi:phosphoglycolate phosphatase-like HAD superfamily hydrolase